MGTCYQAFSGIYLWRSTPCTERLLHSGAMLSARSLQKIRAQERGMDYAIALLREAGAPAPGPDLRAWLRAWVPGCLLSRCPCAAWASTATPGGSRAA